ncbi:hypothetical protein F0U63_45990 [Cystobacter fuscus]|nr:hypothetical protein F0U63_45990 [Cystobacter fuscus]
MNRNMLLFLIVFIVGCAAGMSMDSRALAQGTPPPAPAASAPPIQKWEYFCERNVNDREVNESANRAGQKGWELVGVTSTNIAIGNLLACYKRPAS